MSGRGAFVLLQRLLAVVVLVASGVYLLVYLYRWEWNRAVISGLVFVAAEIAVATSMLGRRLGASQPQQPASSFDLALARFRQAGAERRRPFRWLEPPDRFGVFIPVLLGAGVVLSALAYLVERLAEATAQVTIDRRLARRLSLLAAARPASAPADVLQWTRAPRRVGPLAGLVAVLVIGGLGIQVLAELTQSRSDRRDLPARTTIVIAVDQRTSEPVLDTAEALWVACRPVLPGRHRPDARIESLGGNEVQLVLEPGIRELTTRRLNGCLGDALISSVRVRVLDVVHRSA